MSLPVDNGLHELKLGNSFDSNPKVGFHTIRYDFKPASVDTSKEACLEVNDANQVAVLVPHVEGAGTPCTVFKGNKQKLMKECVLIIDHETGTYTLEKLTTKVAVKKTRFEGSSKAMQQMSGRVTPVDLKKATSSTSVKPKNGSKVSPMREPPVAPVQKETKDIPKVEDTATTIVGEISDSSSSSSSSSSDEEEMEVGKPSEMLTQKSSGSKASASEVSRYGVLDNDLALSESGSDSD